MLFSNLGKAIRFNEYWEKSGNDEAEDADIETEIQTTSKTKPPTTKTPCQAANMVSVRPVAAAAVCAVCACRPMARLSA